MKFFQNIKGSLTRTGQRAGDSIGEITDEVIDISEEKVKKTLGQVIFKGMRCLETIVEKIPVKSVTVMFSIAGTKIVITYEQEAVKQALKAWEGVSEDDQLDGEDVQRGLELATPSKITVIVGVNLNVGIILSTQLAGMTQIEISGEDNIKKFIKKFSKIVSAI